MVWIDFPPPQTPEKGGTFQKTIFNSFSLLILVSAMWFWAQNNRNYMGQMSSNNMWPFGNFRGRRKQNIENIVKKSERGFQMLWLPPLLFSYYLFYPSIILYNISDLRAFFPENWFIIIPTAVRTRERHMSNLRFPGHGELEFREEQDEHIDESTTGTRKM